MSLETIVLQPDAALLMCAVCASDRSGGQIALFVIITSFITMALANRAYKKYIKKNQKITKNFKI
tara:strand:+ start:1608 stop:1802 length:195 start_codon:yes stop_codon:yes gene_type:complete